MLTFPCPFIAYQSTSYWVLFTNTIILYNDLTVGSCLINNCS